MKDFTLKHYKKVCFLLGVLSVLGLPPYFLLPILFFTFSLFIYILNACSDYKKSFLSGYWFGFGYFSFGLSWIGNALLVDWQTTAWLYPFVPLLAGGFFGLFMAIPACLTTWFSNIYGKYFALSSLMVIAEWVRSFLLTGFPWNLVGYVWGVSDITIQAASLFGTYGLSLISWLVFSSPALFCIKKDRISLFITLIVNSICLFFLFIFGIIRLNASVAPSDTLNIRIVQPSIPQSLKWNRDNLEKNFEEYINLSKSESLDDIDFVIWGETASPFALDADSKHLKQILDAVPNKGRLITGMVRYEITPYENYLLYNSMVIIAKNGSIDDIYDKSHLVPFGEYIPLKEYLPSWIRPLTDVIGEFQAGSGPRAIKIKDFPALGGLICYEVIFPTRVVSTKNRPLWLVNVTNDGWYGISSGPYQHFETARFRAVEEGLPMIRAANSGISAAIDAYGRIIGFVPLQKKSVLDVKLPIWQNLSTTYGKLGNLFPLILCLANIILAFYFNGFTMRNS